MPVPSLSERAFFLSHGLRDRLATRPKAQFELYAADGDDVRRLLDEDRIDIALLLEPVETAKYESVPLALTERWGVVVRTDDPAASAESLSMDALRWLSLILPLRHMVRDTLHGWFDDASETLTIAGYHNVPTNALELVLAGLGALLCVEVSYTMRPSADLRFIPLAPERRTHQLSRSAEDFWQMCVTHATGASSSGCR